MSAQDNSPKPMMPLRAFYGHIVSMICLATAIIVINGFEFLAGQPRLGNEVYVLAGQNVGYGAFMCWYHAKVTTTLSGISIQT